MYKTVIIDVKCNKADIKYLGSLNMESAKVWNRCVEVDREWFSRTGKYIKPTELQTALLGFSFLPRSSVYLVYRKYLAARNAMFRSIQMKHEASQAARLPYKNKKYFNTAWDASIIKIDYEKRVIKLSRRSYVDENGKRCCRPPVICHAKTIPQNIVEIELLYRDGLKLAIKYKEPDIDHLVPSGNSAAIDLGEIHSITAIDKGAHAMIITGRKLRSIKRFRDKEVSKVKSLRSRCKKGSRRYRKLSKAIWELHHKADNQINDAVHKTTKLFLDYCIKRNITTVYYGDLDSATRNTKGKINSHVGQKLNEWCYGQIVRQLENKLERYGITLIRVDEGFSSQTCPACGNRKKSTSRNYRCQCGYEQHRDIVGAMNILNINAGTELSRYTDKMYLRIA